MHGRRFETLTLAVFFVVAGVLFLGQGSAYAADSTASNKVDQQCLACHSIAGMEKELQGGEKLSLYVDGAKFAKSVHSMIGCAVCHGTVTLENHPPSKTKIPSLREYSIERSKVCASCHGDVLKLYQNSIHAALVRDGNPVAPICTDCHNPHTAKAKAAYDASTGAPCSKCHGSIFEAYAGSVHGKASLDCSVCHRAHDVSPATKGNQLKDACLGCHQDALAVHETWLPNAAQHFETVSCPACHVPGVKRKVDLRLYDSVTKQNVGEKEGVPQFDDRVRSAKVKGGDLDALALHSLLREFNRDGTENKTTLRGRLEVSSGVDAHRLAGKSRAVRDCAQCHQQGADAFQSVTVSIVGPDGRPVSYGAKPEVLHSVISMESVGGFYAIGGTRIKLLDWLLVLAVLGGIGVPIGHMTVRWMFKKYAKKISGKEDS